MRKNLLITLLALVFCGSVFAVPTLYVDGDAQTDIRDGAGNVALSFAGPTQTWTLLAEFAGWAADNNFGYYTDFADPAGEPPTIIFPGSDSPVINKTTTIAAGTDIGLYMKSEAISPNPTLYSHFAFNENTPDDTYQYFYVYDVSMYRGMGKTYFFDTENEDYSTTQDFDYLIYIDDSGAALPEFDHNDMIIGVTAVPEPTTMLLFGLGMLGVGVSRRLRK